MTDFCLDCLRKLKPWVTDDMVILYSQPSQCSKCGEVKKLVCVYTDNDEKLLVKRLGTGIQFNAQWYIYFTSQPSTDIDLVEVEITLRDLVVSLGWDTVRDIYMYIEGQENGKPLAFRTHKEYEPYLDYRVINLNNKTILRSPYE